MNFCIEITSERKGFYSDMKEVRNYRCPVFLLVRKNFALSSKQTIPESLRMLFVSVLHTAVHSTFSDDNQVQKGSKNAWDAQLSESSGMIILR